jgi:precorrin-2 dehydrogenase / sirohydrochlorin ferrochelatase
MRISYWVERSFNRPHSNMSDYPEILPGGSLPLAWQLKDKRVVLIGGGVVAAGRLVNILQADALVTLIAPSSHLNNEVRYRITEDPICAPRITYVDRLYKGPEDLQGADMVLTAIDDNEASLAIWEHAKALKIPVNVADVPPNCDFYFGSQIRRGPLQILVSTNGRGPKLAAIIRQRLGDALPPNVELAIDKVGRLREKLRVRAPGVGGKLGRDRMKWMIGICDTWDMEQLAELDEGAMDKLLDEGWDKKTVPEYSQIMGGNQRGSIKHLDGGVLKTTYFAGGLILGGMFAIWRARR